MLFYKWGKSQLIRPDILFKFGISALLFAAGLSLFNPREVRAEQNSCSPDRHIEILSPYIPLYLESANNGVFVQMMNQIAAKLKYRLSWTIQPAQRSWVDYTKGKADIYFPHVNRAKADASGNLSSLPFYHRRDFAFVRKGKKVPNSIEDLQGETIGLNGQYQYPKSLLDHPGIRFDKSAKTDRENLLKVIKKRNDVALVEEYSALWLIQSQNLSEVTYNSDTPIFSLEVFSVFRNDDCGTYLNSLFTPHLMGYYESGKLKELVFQAMYSANF